MAYPIKGLYQLEGKITTQFCNLLHWRWAWTLHTTFKLFDFQSKWQAKDSQIGGTNKDYVFYTRKQVCSRCFDFNNVGSIEGGNELGYLVFIEVAKWDHCNSAQSKKKWKYLSQTSSNQPWSSLFEAMGARERRLYWDQEKDPKQEGENDCRC